MQAEAKAKAEEEARAKAAAEEKAKVEAQRKAAEQAALNSLGLGDKIKAYEAKIAEGGLSNSEEYSIQQALEGLRA